MAIKADWRCSECSTAYRNRHHHDCSQQTQVERIKRLRETLAMNVDARLHAEKQFKRWNEIAGFWHGKYAIVKNENNVLRRKVSKQRRRTEETNHDAG